MCTRSHPHPVPETRLFSAEAEDSEREASDEGARERESDRDSAVGSTRGSDSSDGLRAGDKDDALGELFFPVEK